ncbi:3352_t:CDS:2, partial [Acaulospora colombiana]
GESDNLYSAFHLKYSMILNMTRAEGLGPELLLKKSFYQFQNTAHIPRLEEELRNLEKNRDSLVVPDEETVAGYYESRKLLRSYYREMRSIINHPSHVLTFLKPGRLVRIKHANMEFGWGMVVAYGKRKNPEEIENSNSDQPTLEQKETLKNLQNKRAPLPGDYFVDVLLYCDPNSIVAKTADGITTGVRPCKENEPGEMMVVPVELSTIRSLSAIRIFSPKNLTNPQVRQGVYESIQSVIKQFPDGLIPLDPIEDMGISNENFQKLIRKIEILEDKVSSNPLFGTPHLPALYERYSKKVSLLNRIKKLKSKIGVAQSILHLDDLKYRKRILRRIGYLTDDD